MTVITVSQVNTYIKALLDESAPLKNICIVGEISNFLHYSRSGHMYFTLKDDKSQLKSVMFSSYAQRLKFQPENGMRVICRGRISVYEKDGAYQLYVEDMQPDGLGALNLAFDQLKEKLSKEGLFDSQYKKSLPQYPNKIGVATSDMGAAIEDIKNITARRYPLCELVIVPTIVQGEQAPSDIVNSLRILDSIDDIDLIIVGRGGGSIEDLWAFNTEEVARAVFNCKKPVVSAVGHETDYTICDFVADLRAPTPSAAAELAVPNCENIIAYLEKARSSMRSFISHKVENENQRLDYMLNDSLLSKPNEYFDARLAELDVLNKKICERFVYCIDKNKLILSSLAGRLDALSPLAVISRGYNIATKDNKVVKNVSSLEADDRLSLKFSDGEAVCTVNEVIK